jgi:hypothetical protein
MPMQKAMAAVGLLALAVISVPAMAQTSETNLPWCGYVDGATECVYPTLQECERWMQPEGQMCVPNPRGGDVD